MSVARFSKALGFGVIELPFPARNDRTSEAVAQHIDGSPRHIEQRIDTQNQKCVGESTGGLPPDSLVEKEADALRDSGRLMKNTTTTAAMPCCVPRSLRARHSGFHGKLMRESAARASTSSGASGTGVDGVASNEATNLFQEARQACR